MKTKTNRNSPAFFKGETVTFSWGGEMLDLTLTKDAMRSDRPTGAYVLLVSRRGRYEILESAIRVKVFV